MRSSVAAWTIGLGALWPALAGAAGEQELQLATQIAYANVNADGRTPSGGGIAVDLQYGFTDAWSARLSGSFSAHPVEKQEDPRLPGGVVRAQSAVLGLTYALDVLRFVPSFELGAGLLAFNGAVTRSRIELAVQVGVGADYYLNRKWTLGAVIRYLFAPADLTAFPPDFSQTPFSFSLGVRASRIW